MPDVPAEPAPLPGPAPAAPSAGAAAPAAPAPPAEPRKVILVVDDIPQVRKILCHELQKAGYTTLEARNGLEALDRVRSVPVHAIILDAMMPEMDGFTFCRTLKADPAGQAIPVLFLTARQSQEDVLKAIQAGARDYLVKPYKRDVLLERLGKILAAPAPPAAQAS